MQSVRKYTCPTSRHHRSHSLSSPTAFQFNTAGLTAAPPVFIGSSWLDILITFQKSRRFVWEDATSPLSCRIIPQYLNVTSVRGCCTDKRAVFL